MRELEWKQWKIYLQQLGGKQIWACCYQVPCRRIPLLPHNHNEVPHISLGILSFTHNLFSSQKSYQIKVDSRVYPTIQLTKIIMEEYNTISCRWLFKPLLLQSFRYNSFYLHNNYSVIPDVIEDNLNQVKPENKLLACSMYDNKKIPWSI
jgi:hypothetical protein